MSAATHGIAFALGLVVTVAVLGLMRHGPVEAPEVPAPVADEGPPPPMWVRADCPEEPNRGRELAERTQALDDLEAELEAAAAYEEEATGAPLEWPDPIPDGFDEVAVAAALDGIAGETGAEVIGIDCGEFPCVAVLGMEGDDPDQVETVRRRLDQAYPESSRTEMWWTGEDGQTIAGSAVMVAITPSSDLDEDATERVGFRLQEIDEIFSPVEFFGLAPQQ